MSGLAGAPQKGSELMTRHRKHSIADSSSYKNNVAPDAALGTDASIVAKRQKTTERYDLLATAQHILIKHNVLNSKGDRHRTRLCHAARAYNPDKDHIEINMTGESASLGNVQTCGSVWTCPVCAARRAMEEANDMRRTLIYAERENLVPIMLTLTARHHAGMTLEYFMSRFKKSFRQLTQDRAYRSAKARLQVQHTIKAREVTHGENGWHYHLHGLFFVPSSVFKAITDGALANTLHEDIPQAWQRKLQNNELDGLDGIACDWSVHGNIGEQYLSKLGLSDRDCTDAGFELTGGAEKSAGTTIWQLLRQARDGDETSEKLFVEHAEALFGTNWITYSQGLRDLVSAIELPSDEDEPPGTKVWMLLTDADYRPVRVLRAYSELLRVASETQSRDAVRRWLKDAAARCVARDRDRLRYFRQQYSRAYHQHQMQAHMWGADDPRTKQYFRQTLLPLQDRIEFYKQVLENERKS